MTCNPQWEEIVENLYKGQVPVDRPDLVDIVFYLKVKALMNEIAKRTQGRGLPHIHLLLTLFDIDKVVNAEDVEKRGISARIPDKDKDIELYDLVKKFMIHGPCGDLDPNCPCMEEKIVNGKKIRKCSKGYPKLFQEETLVLENGLALYSRPRDGRIVEVFVFGKRFELDNRWVVPHNPYLLKMFRCHINVEKVNSVTSVKYLHKYVHKLPDRATMNYEEKNDYDEIKEYIDARYICPQEAVWRILEYPTYDRSHSITTLPVHLDGEHVCYFDENMNEDEIREKIRMILTRNLFYHEIPEKFVFRKGKWNERKTHFNTIGRMVKISPAETERYHLRLLLLNVRGAISYEDLRTVKNIDLDNRIRCATFAEACLARGLIRDDEEWKKALEEANIHCNPAKPDELWALFKDALSEDFAKKFSIELAHRKAYIDIAKRMLQAGKSLADFPALEQIDDLDLDLEEQFNLAEELDIGRRSYELLNDEQKEIVDEIMNRISNPDGKMAFYFLSGPGGSGKTFVISTLVHLIRGMKKKVSTMAFTGIAATLFTRRNWNLENMILDIKYDKDEMILPIDCISKGDLVEEIFGYAIADSNWNQMANMAIVAPKNVDVKDLNSKVLNMLPGNEILYKSIDKAENEEKQVLDEYLDELKKNAIVMLIRNMNIENGLCNGTRMLVEEMRPNMIVCRLLSGDRAGQLVYIPRITLCCDGEYPFDLHRHQFPLVLAFAMTVNKAQGQTLEKLGIDLTKDVFSHGQLYVALSRVRTWKALSIRLLETNNERKVMNVVYKEILDKDD
uniref:ATP-dependent DNA helicase n=1 Tax=Meloidogyne hapla TaxID=6305 RepID=A0A1I8B240_MELHA